MNMKIKIKVLFVLSLVTVLGFSILNNPQENDLIVGVWVAEGNSLENRWAFGENRILTRYDENTIYKKYNWSIETTSPQCGQNVATGNNFSYLKLVNLDDSNDKYCYEIFSLNEKILQIRYFNTSSLIYMNKQN